MNSLADLLGALAAVFPNPPASPERMAAYTLALSDMSAAECRTAFLVLSRDRERRFHPSPGEILAACRPEPTDAECAALWDRIGGRVMFRRHTLAQIAEEFGVAAHDALIAAGGPDVCWADGTDAVFALQRFTESYREERLSPRAAIGTMDERIASLIGDLARAKALPA